MAPRLTASDAGAGFADTYRRNGFALLPGVLSPQQTRPLVEAIEAIQAALPELQEEARARLVMERDLPASKRGGGGLSADSFAEAVFIIGEPPAFDFRFIEALLLPALLEPVQHLLHCQDIRYQLSNVTMKHPRVGSGIAWHRDFPNRYICPPDSSFLRLMLCLDGMNAENGATEFIPGSHRLSDRQASTSNAAEALTQAGARRVSASCPPGSLLLIHPKVVHGGPPNTSNQQRRNLIVQWGLDTPLSGAEFLSGYGIEALQTWVDRQR